MLYVGPGGSCNSPCSLLVKLSSGIERLQTSLLHFFDFAFKLPVHTLPINLTIAIEAFQW